MINDKKQANNKTLELQMFVLPAGSLAECIIKLECMPENEGNANETCTYYIVTILFSVKDNIGKT